MHLLHVALWEMCTLKHDVGHARRILHVDSKVIRLTPLRIQLFLKNELTQLFVLESCCVLFSASGTVKKIDITYLEERSN